MDFLTSLDNYNIFYEVAKEKNITKASEKLFISQPAVSQAIKKLEDNLGLKLFVRSKRGIELTSIGQKIFVKVENAMHNFSAIEQLVDEEKGLLRGDLIFGSGSNVARQVLCKPIAAFIDHYPLINVKIIESVQSKMIDMLKSGQINFVLTQRNSQINFPFIPIFKTQYCFVKSPACEINRFITTSQGSYSHLLLEEFIEKENISDVQTLEIAGYKTALDLALLGTGIVLAPYFLVEENIKEKKLEECFSEYSLPTIEFGVYYNTELSTPATERFIEYLKQE